MDIVLRRPPGAAAPDLKALAASAARRVEDLSQAFIHEAEPFDAYDILVNLFLKNTPLNVETYKESNHPGLLAIPETAALLLLGRQDRAGDGSWLDGPVPGATIERLDSLQHDLQSALVMERVGSLGSQADRGLATVRFLQASKEQILRNPSYPDKEEESLRELFGQDPLQVPIAQMLGFAIEDGLALLHAFEEMPLTRLRDRAGQIREMVTAILDAQDAGLFSEIKQGLDALRQRLGRQGFRRGVQNFEVALAWNHVGDTIGASEDDIATFSKVPMTGVKRFLELFRVDFGHAKAGPAHLRDLSLIKRRPILVDRNGRYLCVSPSNVLFSLRPSVEEVIQGDPKLWESYQRHRGRLVQDRSRRLLEQTLRPQQSHSNLKYRTADGDDGEVDGLMVLDTVALVIESKGGTLSPSARRAAPRTLIRDLTKLLTEGERQCRRAASHVLAGGTFRDSFGRAVALDLSRVNRVQSLVVTLDDLSSLAPNAGVLLDAGLLTSAPDSPLFISLHDLDVICELVEFPAQFIHYLDRRQHLRSLKNLVASDELDFFMYYLKRGLNLDDIFSAADPPTTYQLLSFTDELDAYLMHKTGDRRTPAKKPRQEIPRKLREVLLALDEIRPPGFVPSTLQLLECDGQVRESIARQIAKLQRSSRADGQFHDATFAGTGHPSWGITFMSGPAGSLETLRTRLTGYCRAKKYQLKCDAWSGFGFLAGAPGAFQGHLFLPEPWVEDPQLEELVATLGLQKHGEAESGR